LKILVGGIAVKKRNLFKRLCAGALAVLLTVGNLSGVSTPVSAARWNGVPAE